MRLGRRGMRRLAATAWLGAGAAAPDGAPDRATPCWQSDNAAETQRLCCAPDAVADALASAVCFDSVFTRRECCDGLGYAVEAPEAAAEPFPTALAFREDGWVFDAEGHPAFGERQRRFEERHAEASQSRTFGWQESSGAFKEMSLRAFKLATGPAMDAMIELSAMHHRSLSRVGDFEAGGVLLDIGAGLGALAIHLALAFPRLRVVATEASPENYRYLVWNIRESGVADRVFPLNVALRTAGQASEVLAGYSPERPTDTWYCDLRDDQACGALARVVPALTLAELLRRLRLRRVQWLKLCGGCARRAAEDAALLLLLREAVHVASAELRDDGAVAVDRFCQWPDEAEEARRSTGADARPVTCALEPCRLGGSIATSVGSDGRRAVACARPWEWHTFAGRDWHRSASAGRCDAKFVEFERAAAHCERSGARLCTAEELRDCAADARWECGLADELVWSSTPCGVGGRLSVRANGHCSLGAKALASQCGGLAYAGRCCAEGGPVAEGHGHELQGRRVFVMSSLSQDDVDQWPLLEHWLRHYRDTLGLPAKHFLLILHSDYGDRAGLARRARWLYEEYGVRNVFPTMEPYHARRHMAMKYEVLQRFATFSDWVMQVDSDEFVFFQGAQSAYAALEELEVSGHSAQFGLMVDRLAPDGNIDAEVVEGRSIFGQFPLNCALTVLLQHSDARKACAYKGFLRSTAGNHNILGLNWTGVQGAPGNTAPFRRRIRRIFGQRVYDTLPDTYRSHQALPYVSAAHRFATVYHFKWIKGLGGKLLRRAQTAPDIIGQYTDVLAVLLGQGSFQDRLATFCSDVGPPEQEMRALTSVELTRLFQRMSEDDVRKQWEATKLREDARDWFNDQIAWSMHHAMQHGDVHVPTA